METQQILHTIEEMPATTRVWVYKADRFLTEAETQQAEQRALAFTAQWAAHGKALTATAFVQDKLWLVFAVDESKEGASGCSIDKVFRLVQELEQDLHVRFTDRLLLAWEKDGNIQLTPLSELAAAGVTADTPVFDDTVQTLGNWYTRRKKASESWVKRYL